MTPGGIRKNTCFRKCFFMRIIGTIVTIICAEMEYEYHLNRRYNPY